MRGVWKSCDESLQDSPWDGTRGRGVRSGVKGWGAAPGRRGLALITVVEERMWRSRKSMTSRW